MAEGLITIAYGDPVYVRMAIALAKSYRRLNGDRPIAVITDDRHRAVLERHYDEVIPVRADYGAGVVQKLHLDHYSPFDDTLFVDSDCLFYKDPENLWKLYSIRNFSARGWRYLTGTSDYEKSSPYEFVDDVATCLAKVGLKRLPHFNSGVLFFRRSQLATRIFEDARSVFNRRVELGFTKFKNAPIADEPAFGIAMELNGVPLDPWDADNGMETALQIQKIAELNVAEGRARFTKGDTERSPTLLHFNVGAQYSYIYNREVFRLETDGQSGLLLRKKLSFWSRWLRLQVPKHIADGRKAWRLLRHGRLMGRLRVRLGR